MEGFNWSILGWVAGLVFVYLFGIFEGRAQGRKRRIAEEEKEKKEQPTPTPAEAGDPGLLRIKNENGVMALDLDGKHVNATSLSAEQRKRLIELLNMMRPWLEGKSASVPRQTVPPPAKLVADTPKSTPVPLPQSQPAPPVISNPSATGQPSETTKKKDEPEPVPTSIVEQINMVLQKRIANTPLASRGVSLMESPTGGVNVFVGVQRFEGVDDVPDEAIKAAIRAAIAEWENKYTPGL